MPWVDYGLQQKFSLTVAYSMKDVIHSWKSVKVSSDVALAQFRVTGYRNQELKATLLSGLGKGVFGRVDDF